VSNLNILVFHKIVENEISEWADINLALFTQLLEVAKSNGQKIVTISDWAENNRGELALSFDDGHSSDFEVVLPLLQEYGAQGTFFVTPNYVGKKGYMSWEQIKILVEAGMEIGSHSLSHPFMTNLSKEKLLIELKDSKAQIEQYTSKEVESFAYPFGDCSVWTHKVAIKVGYKNICNSKPGLCKPEMSILSRNSVHSNITPDMIGKLLSPNASEIIKKKAGYFIRYGLKRVLGINNYIKLKDSIF